MMQSFLDSLRAGPEIPPTGDYAMWFPSSSEASFSSSSTRSRIECIYKAAAGIEPLAFADILRQVGQNQENSSRIALPDDLFTVVARGPGNEVFIISASSKKGIRFHFHKSTAAEYRAKILDGFTKYLVLLRKSVPNLGPQMDATSESSPVAWWGLMERAIAEMEKKEVPIRAVGIVILQQET